MSDDLEPAESFLAGVMAKLQAVDGACDQHGASTVHVRPGAPWHCPRCLEAAMRAETQQIWLAEREQTLMRAACIPAKYIGQQFPATTPDQRLVRATVKKFRDVILSTPQWMTLIMVGRTGTGKTLLACELAQALIKKASRSVRYITAKGMIGEIQASYGREGKTEEGELMRFTQYDVLILDEIDAISSKENSSLLLTEVINRRYNENKPVIAITNQPFDDLAKYVGDRVHSRLHENALLCSFTWSDFRKT